MIPKYNYHDIKNGGTQVPEDANKQLRSAFEKLGSDVVNKMIDGVEKKRLFGKGYVVDANMFVFAEIQFQAGICEKFDLIEDFETKLTPPFKALFRRSIRNNMVSFKKQRIEQTK